MIRKTIYILPILFLFSACASTQKTGKDKNIDIPESYQEKEYTTRLDSLLSWSDFFTDSLLNHSIEQAITYNFDLRLALKNTEYIHQYFQSARRAWLPELAISPAASWRRNTDSEALSGGRSQQSFQVPLTFSWEIDIWGKLNKEKQAVHAEYLGSIEAARAVQAQIIAQTAELYYTILLQREQQEVLENLLALNDSITQMEQTRYDLGYTTSIDLRQARAQHNTVQLSLLELKEQMKLNENAFTLLTGTQMPEGIPSGAQKSLAWIENNIHTGIPSELLKNRPDILRAEYAIYAADARVGIAKRNFYPSLTITAQGGLSESNISDLFNLPGALFAVAEGAIVQPIFQRRRLKTAYKQAIIQKETAEIEFEKTFTTAYTEVKDALVKSFNLWQQKQLSQERAHDLEKAMKEGHLYYQTGPYTYIEYLVLQQNHLDALSTEAQIRCRYYLSLIELYRALGGGSY